VEEYNEYNWAPAKKHILVDLGLENTKHNMKVLNIVLEAMIEDKELTTTYTVDDEGKFRGKGYVLKECL
jgi:hypothetical protein